MPTEAAWRTARMIIVKDDGILLAFDQHGLAEIIDRGMAAPAVPPVSKILGNCDNAHLVMPHTKCNECLNWKPEAAPAVPERKPLNNSSWKNCGHPVFLGTS